MVVAENSDVEDNGSEDDLYLGIVITMRMIRQIPDLDSVHSTGANYFILVRPLHALKCEQARGVWGHAPPGLN